MSSQGGDAAVDRACAALSLQCSVTDKDHNSSAESPVANQDTGRVLEALQEAACCRPLTEEEFQQVSRLLTTSSTDTSLACAILSILHTALSTHPPLGSHTQTPSEAASLARSLLTAFTSLLTASMPDLKPSNGHLPPAHVLMADYIGQCTHALLQPIALWAASTSPKSCGPANELARFIVNKFLARSSTGNDASILESLPARLLCYGFPWLRGPATAAYHQAAAEAAAKYPQLCSPLSKEHAPGGHALLAAATVMDLLLNSQSSPASEWPYDLYPLAAAPIMLHLRVVMLLERDVQHIRMPDAGVAMLLRSLLRHREGKLCEPLLRSMGSLQALGLPLQALADNPTSWDCRPYCRHINMLACLAQWTASVMGLKGAETLAGHLAQPAVGALSALLNLDPAEDPGAATTILAALTLMLHLAATNTGRQAIINACSIARWLEQIQKWHAQRPTLVTVLACVLHVVSMDPCFSPYPTHLYRNGAWQKASYDLALERAPSRRGPDNLADELFQQLASSSCMKSLAFILRANPRDWKTKEYLAGPLYYMARTPHWAAMQPVMGVLLEDFSPRSTRASLPATSSSRPGRLLTEVEDTTDTLVGAMATGQHALGAVIACLCTARKVGSGSAGQAGNTDPQPVVDVALEWLETFATGAYLSSHGCTDAGAYAARILLMKNLSNLRNFGLLLDKQLILGRSVTEHLAAMVAQYQTDDEWCVGIDLLLKTILPHITESDLTAESFDGENSVTHRLSAALAAPGVLQALLQHFDRTWKRLPEPLRRRSASLPERAEAPSSYTNVVEMTLQYELCLLAYVSKSSTWGDEPEACLSVMEAASVWELVRKLEGDQPAPHLLIPDAVRCMYDFLLLQMLNLPGTEQAQRANVLLKTMDLEGVLANVRQLPLRAHLKLCEQYAWLYPDLSAQRRTSTAAAADSDLAGPSSKPSATAASSTGRSSSSTGAAGSTSSPAASGSRAAGGETIAPAGPLGDVRECSVCQKQPEHTFLCSRCAAVRYCSAACQRAG